MNASIATRIAHADAVMNHSMRLQYLVRAIREGRKDQAIAELRSQAQQLAAERH